jgi:hypothetical protein
MITQQQGQLRIFDRKMFCRSRYNIHKIKRTNRVKKPDTEMCTGGCQPREEENCAKKTDNSIQRHGQQTCSKLSAVVAGPTFNRKNKT